MQPDVEAIAERWSLQLGDAYEDGQTSWVLRATSPTLGPVVLKVLRRHHEADHEAEGLRFWNGDGAIRVHDAVHLDDGLTALVLERCEPGAPLRSRPGPEQDEVIAGLLHRLWREPHPVWPFRPLEEMCDRWADERSRRVAERGGSGVDAALDRVGMDLFRSLPRSAPRHVLLCTDLHAGNVLSAAREPWLMIDPKPYVGDPTYDALQHMLNDEARLVTAPLEFVARMADLLGLDRDRLRLWLFARLVQQAYSVPWMGGVAVTVAPS